MHHFKRTKRWKKQSKKKESATQSLRLKTTAAAAAKKKRKMLKNKGKALGRQATNLFPLFGTGRPGKGVRGTMSDHPLGNLLPRQLTHATLGSSSSTQTGLARRRALR
jgi:hypothetical protein